MNDSGVMPLLRRDRSWIQRISIGKKLQFFLVKTYKTAGQDLILIYQFLMKMGNFSS